MSINQLHQKQAIDSKSNLQNAALHISLIQNLLMEIKICINTVNFEHNNSRSFSGTGKLDFKVLLNGIK